VLLIGAVLVRPQAWSPTKVFNGRDNVQIAEAQSWWFGRLHLPERRFDTASVGGQAYSHFPPLFSFMAALIVPFYAGVPQWLVWLIVVIPIPVFAYRLFWIRTGSVLAGVVLAIGLVCGTSVWPVIDRALQGGAPYFVNHALATTGLCILLAEYFGPRRPWVVGAGLVLAALSRQMTIAYALPLLWMVRGGAIRSGRSFWPVGGAFVLVVAILAGSNALKFGHPLDSGYIRIYEGRDDALASFAHRHGLFSLHFVPKNLYYALLGLPEVEQGDRVYFPKVEPSAWGTGILWTTPLLFWLAVDFRRVFRDRRNWPLLAASGMVFAVLMCFHTTGYTQRGFNRFSLDYLPVLLAMLAPLCMKRERRWISVAMVVWSVVYFRWLI